MSRFEKRAREEKRDRKARDKEQRRLERRNMPSNQPEIVTAASITGNLPSIDDVMASIQNGGTVSRSAAPMPSKLFVGSLNDSTTSATLRAHFEPYGVVAEAVVITDRSTGASRNFGFVTMADRRDAARAISALHHSELEGNSIVVDVATER